MHKRVGTYWHMLPQQNQARKVIWDGIVYNEHGEAVKVLDWAFPKELRKSTHSQEMKITLLNGSVWQLCGSDNYDALVGSNPVGVVMSEYSVAKPSAWDYIRPILAENDGWALFIYTPRGRNHGAKLYDMACNNPDWFAQILTADDTQAISADAVEDERRAGMIEEMIQQEFYCSFEGVMVGSYYGPMISDAQKEGRITRVPHDPIMQVFTSWDLGMADTTAIWFFQLVPHAGEVRVIDYYQSSGEGLAHYAQVLGAKPYTYAEHYAPHDIMVRENKTMEVSTTLRTPIRSVT
jgi:phage terminase large subunit